MPSSRQIQTEGPSKSEEATRAQDDQLKKEDPHEVRVPVTDGKEIAFSSDEEQTLRSLTEALQNQKDYAATPLIRKVTKMLRDNEDFLKYFVPSAIAIGPLHHDGPGLQQGEKLKLKLAAHFIDKRDKSIIKAFFTKINGDLENLKKCYDPDDIEIYDDKQLSRMFFVDGCAVLYLLHYLYSDFRDEIEIRGNILAYAEHDLIMLENQLPYRLIQTLISTTNKKHGEELKESIIRFIDESTMTLAEREKKGKIQHYRRRQEANEQQQPAHLLELLRVGLLDVPQRYEHCMGKVWRSIASPLARYMGKVWRSIASPLSRYIGKIWRSSYMWKVRRSRYMGKVWRPIASLLSRYRRTSHHSYTFHNIKELKGRGILLRPSKTSSLKDVSFHRSIFTGFLGILKVPPITLGGCTVTRFMNLIAYEMSPDFDNNFDISSYIFFLDSLIDQAEDVKELRDSGILHNTWGSDEDVANLFNKMGPETVHNLKLYSKVKEKIQSHCNNQFYSRWYTFFAEAHRIYFSSPWAVIALLGAVAALVLSATQTYYTIHSTSQRN